MSDTGILLFLMIASPPRISESETIPGKISDLDMPHLLLTLYNTVHSNSLLVNAMCKFAERGSGAVAPDGVCGVSDPGVPNLLPPSRRRRRHAKKKNLHIGLVNWLGP